MNEVALEPDLPICDPHHHLWEHPDHTYLLEELHADTGSGHNITTTVFVECGSEYRTDGPVELQPVGETDFVADQAAASEAASGANIAGIVGFADLTLGEAVKGPLEAHVEAGGGRFRGIRHATGWHQSDQIRNSHTQPTGGLMADDSFRAGLATLGQMGLSFDAWLYHPQLDEVVDMASAHPDVQIILDHIGGPLGVGPYAGMHAEVLDEWRPKMAALAECENVALKVGGIGMPIFGFDWHKSVEPTSSEELAAAWGGELSWCIEAFGVERCMFESNFPVDGASCDYVTLWNTFKRVAADASEADKAALFHDTATAVYRL